MSALAELEEAVTAAAGAAGPAVVGLSRGRGGGSGVVFARGLVLTNAHNLRHDEIRVVFSDGRRETGQVAGVDLDYDVAVLRADTADAAPVGWAPEDAPAKLGQAILALGNPGGRGLRVSPGFVCATSRSFRGPRGRRVAGAVEHTAPLPRGSSGGPLLDTAGRLLGLNTARVEGGLILAVSLDATLRARVEALSRGDTPTSPRLGIAIAPPRVARQLRQAVGLPDRDGVLVRAVEEGSAAERAGIERGDLIVAAAAMPLERVDTLYEVLDRAAEAGHVPLTILRGVEEREIDVSFA